MHEGAYVEITGMVEMYDGREVEVTVRGTVEDDWLLADAFSAIREHLRTPPADREAPDA